MTWCSCSRGCRREPRCWLCSVARTPSPARTVRGRVREACTCLHATNKNKKMWWSSVQAIITVIMMDTLYVFVCCPCLVFGPGLGVPGLTIRFTSDDSGVLLGFQAEVSTAPPTLVMSQQYVADKFPLYASRQTVPTAVVCDMAHGCTNEEPWSWRRAS
jgi:hypothetical protein